MIMNCSIGLNRMCSSEDFRTFSISENTESLLSNCRAKKMYEKVNLQVK